MRRTPHHGSFPIKTAARVAALTTLCLGAAPAWAQTAAAGGGQSQETDPYTALPASFTLAATVRDFRASGEPGGHPDFQRWSGDVRVGLLEPMLDGQGKPVVRSLTGSGIAAPFLNAAGEPINPALYNANLGDVQGQLSTQTEPRFTSPESFNQWYRDVPGTNASTAVSLTLTRVPGTDRYVFDSAVAEPYRTRGGFFPIDGELYGNFQSTGRNFHFTTELETEFQFRRNEGQVFRFAGDDDVWVFIDNVLVIDLGGVHPPRAQAIDLDRLSWLRDGQNYRLKVFHAERRTSGSNFRIETTLRLRQVDAPPSSALFD